MTTHSDEGPEFEPDDPLTYILRPSSDYLAPPAGSYRAIRRGAGRRRMLRTAAGIGVSGAVAAAVLVALPLDLSTSQRPAAPTVPLAPPPPRRPAPTPSLPAAPPLVTPSARPGPVDPSPSDRPGTGATQTASTAAPARSVTSPPVRGSASRPREVPGPGAADRSGR